MSTHDSTAQQGVQTTRAHRPIDLVVFDMTGTTVSDDGVVVQAYQAALAAHGITVRESDLAAARGASKHEVFHRFATQARPGASDAEVGELARAAHADFQHALREAYANGPLLPVPGAGDTLRWLRERGIRVAVTTGFDQSLQRLILRRLGWETGWLDAAVAADEVARGRPAPDMIHLAMSRTGVHDATRVAVVGDTAVDLEAGTNAGAGLVVGVLSGAHDHATLSVAPHTHIVASVADLPALFENLAR